MTYNSTIQPKQKIKSGTPMIFNGETVYVEHDRQDGKVSICFSPERQLTDKYKVVNIEDLTPVQKVRKGLKATPKALSEADKLKNADLKEFFAYQAEQVPERCQNCGSLLRAYSPWAKKCVTAHVLPKSDDGFPTIAAEPDNAMFLGFGLFSDCNCHGDYDNKDAEARKQMKCYSIAISKFERLKTLLNEPDLNKAYKYLGIQPDLI